MEFYKALQKLKQGKKIYRDIWKQKENKYLLLVEGDERIKINCDDGVNTYCCPPEDIAANDWEIKNDMIFTLELLEENHIGVGLHEKDYIISKKLIGKEVIDVLYHFIKKNTSSILVGDLIDYLMTQKHYIDYAFHLLDFLSKKGILEWMNYSITRLMTPEQCVKYAIYAAKSVFKYIKYENCKILAQRCIDEAEKFGTFDFSEIETLTAGNNLFTSGRRKWFSEGKAMLSVARAAHTAIIDDDHIQNATESAQYAAEAHADFYCGAPRSGQEWRGYYRTERKSLKTFIEYGINLLSENYESYIRIIKKT